MQILGSGGLLWAAGSPDFGFVLGVTVVSAAGSPGGLGGSEAAGQDLVLQHERAY